MKSIKTFLLIAICMVAFTGFSHDTDLRQNSESTLTELVSVQSNQEINVLGTENVILIQTEKQTTFHAQNIKEKDENFKDIFYQKDLDVGISSISCNNKYHKINTPANDVVKKTCYLSRCQS
jgi:hypothetical protein